MEQLPQLQPGTLQRVWIVTPVGPTRGDRLQDGVHEGNLPQVLKNLGVLVVLNALTNGLQSDSGGRFSGANGARRIQEYSIARSAQASAARGGIHIVPTADGIACGPAVGAIVQNAGGSLGPIQEPRLDALVDGGIIHHPFRSVAESRVATGIAPEVACAGKGQSGPLLHGIEQHPMVDGTE